MSHIEFTLGKYGSVQHKFKVMGVAAGVAEAPMQFFIKSTRPMAAVAAAFGGYF
jgi:hypothetical protein